MTKSRIFLLSMLIIGVLVRAHVVRADTGPKPTMEFTFTGESATITSGILYECEQSDCSDASPLKELGPQGFTCDASSCSALAYGFSQYHKLEIQFSDGQTRQSNIFETDAFDSKYKVTVRPDDMVVEAQFSLKAFSRVNLLLILCVCMLSIGGLVIGLIIFLVRRSKKN